MKYLINHSFVPLSSLGVLRNLDVGDGNSLKYLTGSDVLSDVLRFFDICPLLVLGIVYRDAFSSSIGDSAGDIADAFFLRPLVAIGG